MPLRAEPPLAAAAVAAAAAHAAAALALAAAAFALALAAPAVRVEGGDGAALRRDVRGRGEGVVQQVQQRPGSLHQRVRPEGYRRYGHLRAVRARRRRQVHDGRRTGGVPQSIGAAEPPLAAASPTAVAAAVGRAVAAAPVAAAAVT